MGRVLAVISVSLLASACGGDNSAGPLSGDDTGPEVRLYRGLALAQTFDPTYPVLAVDQSGNSLVLRQEDGVINGGVFRASNGDQMVMALGSDGRPSRVIVGGHVLLFDNYDGDKVDVGVISPSGEIEIIRGAQFGSFPLAAMAPGPAGVSGFEAAEAYRFASLAWSWFSCGTSVIAAAGSSGVLAVLPYYACGAAVIKTGAMLIPSNDAALAATSSAIALVGSVAGCAVGEPSSCVDGYVAASEFAWSIAQEVAMSLDDEIQVTESALEYGSGDVQITLTWTTTADLDLWVTGPDGDKIYFADPTSPTGGQLDRDDMDGYGPENIFWPAGRAPSGEYLVQVDHYSGASPSSYTVLIQAFGRVKSYSGTVRTDQTQTVARFRSNQPLPVLEPSVVLTPPSVPVKDGAAPHGSGR